MKRIKSLTDIQVKTLFNIIKNNMVEIGFEIKDNDFDIWSTNLIKNLDNNNYYLYLIDSDNETLGFFSLIEVDNDLTLCELQLSNKLKRTKAIINIIKFIFECENFTNKKEIFFSINKKNKMSSNTFKHLGAVLMYENENKCKYKLYREAVKTYLQKFKLN